MYQTIIYSIVASLYDQYRNTYFNVLLIFFNNKFLHNYKSLMVISDLNKYFIIRHIINTHIVN